MRNDNSVGESARPKVERRPQARKVVLFSGIVVRADGTSECGFLDITQGGARLLLPAGEELPADFHLIHVRDRLVYDAKPIWHREGEWGVEFLRTRALDDIADPKLAHLKRLWLELAYRQHP